MKFLGAVVLIAALVAFGCGASSEGTLVVFAAASLTDAAQELSDAFGEANPDVDIEINVGGSSSLREQILDGAPADVFVSANLDVMEDVIEAGQVTGEPQLVARNRMALAVPAGNPGDVDGIEDFADASLLIGVCAEQVPCGALAARLLDAAGVDASVDTTEPDVRSLLTKIEVRELDAALVYVSDVVDNPDVDSIALTAADDADLANDYPAAVLAEADDPELARRFVDFLLSPQAREILREHGFEAP